MSREIANAHALFSVMGTRAAIQATYDQQQRLDEEAREAHVAYAARVRSMLVDDLTAEERVATLNDLPVMPMPTVEQLATGGRLRSNERAAEEIRQAEANRRKRILDDIPNGVVTYRDLLLLQELGVLEGSDPEHVNGTSIDITLGSMILGEDDNTRRGNLLSLRDRMPLPTKQFAMTERVERPAKGVILKPGDFVLAQSQQMFNLPDCISAEYKLKSSMARIGLNHLNAGWCDPGWNGSVLTLELKNDLQHHSILLQLGDRIGQVIFYKHPPVPAYRSYRVRGRYNGDKTVHGVKP